MSETIVFFGSKIRGVALAISIIYFFSHISIAQASNIPTKYDTNNVISLNKPDSSSICQNDLILKNKEIDCIAVEGGFVVAPKEYSSQAISSFESAHILFQDIVGIFKGKIALIVGMDRSDSLRGLFKANHITSINLPTVAERQDMIRAGIARAIHQLNPSLSPSDTDKFTKQALELSIGQTATATLSESGFTQHELCHAWLKVYVHDFTKGNRSPSQARAVYGTILPDWLDEAIAVSCESETDRGRRLNDLVRAKSANELISLTNLLEMSHPRNNRKINSEEQIASKNNKNVKVSVRIIESGQISPTTIFYAQSYGFLKFLREFTKNQNIAEKIINEYLNNNDSVNSIKYISSISEFNNLNLNWIKWQLQNLSVK